MIDISYIIIGIASLCVGFLLGLILARFAAERKMQNLLQELAATKAKLEASEQGSQRSLEMLKELQEHNKAEFENIANRVLESASRKLGADSEKNLAQILSPLRERLQEFQKKVDDSFGQEAKERFALQNEIKRIVEVNERMTLQTESLAKALRGDVKIQGNWGEIMLEKILEQSGLRRDHDYIVQGQGMGLKNDDGKIIRPDVIVNLPDGKHIIIDSKVTLTDYERYHAETEDTQKREMHLKGFLNSLRTHVKGLEERKYQSAETLGTPDFVLMFVPIEGAYSLAVQADITLQDFAWDKKIVIVCPSTLFATLRTVASSWQIVKQNQNAISIAEESGKLYDKFVGFVEDMEAIGTHLGRTQKTFDAAKNKLRDGSGNLIGRAEKIRQMGAKASKNLPYSAEEDADTETGNVTRITQP